MPKSLLVNRKAAVIAAVLSIVAVTPACALDLKKPVSEEAFQESVSTLSNYIKIDTTNPPGNETKGAVYLKEILDKNGIPAQVYETAPGRSCVYARLKGTGKKKALVLLSHIDVVPAQASDWKYPPFDGVIKDGELWGRGAIDMKGMGIMELTALLALKNSGVKLDRDIIFLATPDEEIGGTHGAQWFTKNKKELLQDAEFLINEGFIIDAYNGGKPKYWGVDVAEKPLLWLGLTTRGLAGHASMPSPDSANNRMIAALQRLADNPPPMTVLPEVKEFFTKIAHTEPKEIGALYSDILASTQDEAKRKILKEDKLKSSMLANTVSLTVLKAGYKTNVIPAECYAELDCRLLPGETPEHFIPEIKKALKDDSVEVKILDWEKGDPSPFSSDFVKAVEKANKFEGYGADVPVVPVVVPWFTDSHWFREIGIKAYGFTPVEIDAAHLATMHGKDERIPLEAYRRGIERMFRIIYYLSSDSK